MVTTRAQLSKNAIWVGGSIGYSQSKEDYDAGPSSKTNSLNISPAIGKFIKDNLVVGIKLIYGKGEIENSSYITESDDKSYGGGIFVRKYIPVVSRLYLFGDASATYQNIKSDLVQKDYSSNTSIKTNTKGWNGGLALSPGVSFAINKNIQLESALNNLLGVTYSKRETNSDITGYDKKSSNVNAGIFADGKAEFNIGIRFLLNNKG